ncbi:disrupted in schizophrenia 1 protein-like protein [Amazona aestiva]|uniref:Disrupted in schizophrenia 1 protein-like protein n=1 Tax=Amazona aestiva TaxID=12930 RepID=A0A0Q3URS9_AMAAE|nr:disrupted in schizophrenia 1 protein-like protein [Amazona aestiva]
MENVAIQYQAYEVVGMVFSRSATNLKLHLVHPKHLQLLNHLWKITSVKENAEKYMEILEDKLHSCGSQLLQRVWEADLEACQLLIRGFQLKEASCSGFEQEENQMDEMEMIADGPSDSEKRKEDHFPNGIEWGTVPCSKHGALEEVTEDISFGAEGRLSEEFFIFSAELGEKCKAISEKLVHLEDQLQSSACRVDEGVIHILFDTATDMYQSM